MPNLYYFGPSYEHYWNDPVFLAGQLKPFEGMLVPAGNIQYVENLRARLEELGYPLANFGNPDPRLHIQPGQVELVLQSHKELQAQKEKASSAAEELGGGVLGTTTVLLVAGVVAAVAFIASRRRG